LYWAIQYSNTYYNAGLGAGLAWLVTQRPSYVQSATYNGTNTTIDSSITNTNNPTINNSANGSGTSTNTNTDTDTLTNMPTNTNTATSGKRKKKK
jgi:hypothetical protein